MATVFLNGRFLDQGEARVSAFDAGMQHGVGLFETMLGGTTALDETWVYRLDEHLERLAGSARELGLAEQLRVQGLYDAVMETVARAGHARTRVRVTVTDVPRRGATVFDAGVAEIVKSGVGGA